MKKKTNDDRLSLLRYGEAINNNDFGGGIIELISDNSIINNGNILCNGSHNSYGGSIKIICQNKFENNGIIKCLQNGKIFIRCSEYLKGYKLIYPKPLIITDDDEKNNKNNVFTKMLKYTQTKKNIDTIFTKIEQPLYIKNMIGIKNEKINLKLQLHNGYYKDEFTKKNFYHPSNLLIPSGYYQSKDFSSFNGNDFITFLININCKYKFFQGWHPWKSDKIY